MTDIELDTLELCARGAMTDSWYTKTTSADDATAAYIAVANPSVVRELIAELRQARAERDWLANRLGNLNEESSYSELCPDKFATETVCKQAIKCNTCWLEAAREAVCHKK